MLWFSTKWLIENCLRWSIVFSLAGYGFVDFESPVAAEAAVKALASQGVQAQMAKVCYMPRVNLYLISISLF